ncbi:hypothetical protein [Slackia sp.]|uniref:hypothetical protein n=1 Tax=Slackia sp. TaxID=2049041 RepID=UPI00260437B3|nr:hypothetical protein [Slackia sp.]
MIEIEYDDLADHSTGQHDAGDLQEVSQLRMMGGYELSQQCHEFTHGGYYTEAAESWQQSTSSPDKLAPFQNKPFPMPASPVLSLPCTLCRPAGPLQRMLRFSAFSRTTAQFASRLAK